MSSSSSSDRVPSPLRPLLAWDVALTKQIVTYAYSKYPKLYTAPYKSSLKALEISCHGIPWLALTFIWMYMVDSQRSTQVNLLVALLYDIVFIAVIKAITRRQRPTYTDSERPDRMFFTHGPDKFSFPSGHASRAVLLASFFTHVTGCHCVLVTGIVSTWAAVVSASRIIMRRHHVLDVLCGVLFGLLEAAFVIYFWIGDETSSQIAKWIAGIEDESIGG